MLNWSLLQNLLVIAIACSSITVIFIQKTKKFCRNSKCIIIQGFLTNMILGFFFCQTFTNANVIHSLWVGLFSFLGADTIYKSLEGKLSSYKDLVGKEENTTSPSEMNPDIQDTDVIGEIDYD